LRDNGNVKTARGIEVPEDAIEWTFARSSGAGGQHVNKVSSKATLTVLTASLNGSIVKRERITAAFGEQITVTCQETRSQWRNRELCLAKLIEMIDIAAAPPAPPRRKTKPSRGAIERRLSGKKKDSDKKAGRRGDW
jgi:ribosome-associated protein